MTDTKNECSICLGRVAKKCTLKCSHSFCESCIKKIINHPSIIKCPYCRQDSTGSEILLESGESGESLFVLPTLTTIADGVYVQWDTVGLASYHFGTLSNPYISYESPDCDMWPNLEDGSRPGPKKYFEQHHYDAATRTFTGTINWSPTKWEGDVMWKYTMVFSDDFQTIESGKCRRFGEVNGEQLGEDLFGEDLVYKRVKHEYFQEDEF